VVPGENDGARLPPEEIEEATAFAAELTRLRVRAGMSIREVSRATGIPSATLGGYFSGRHQPSPGHGAQFATLLTALGVPEAGHAGWWDALARVRKVPGPRTVGRPAPYRGLESYRTEDAEWYVGREELVAELCDVVRRLLDRDDAPGIATVVGASGSGKSSLLRAGLVARLRCDGVTAAVLAPGGAPEAALAETLAVLRGESGPASPKRLLVVDQLEEVFADRVPQQERRRFLEALTTCASEPSTAVVLALRADFYGEAMAEPALLPLLGRHQLNVGPLGEDGLRRVVLEPAQRAGRTVEPELVDLMMRDLSPRGVPSAGTLPLLSHALLSTWSRSNDSRLTLAGYMAAGGVAGAVQRTAEQVYDELDAEGRGTAGRLFSQLVDVDDEGFATRRRLHHADLQDDSESLAPVIDAFVASRILTATESTLEIGHEALLTAWPRLGSWIAEDREALGVRRRVSQAAADWERHGREPDGLMRGTLLQQARDVAVVRDGGLTASERAFVADSIEHAEAVERASRRRRGVVRALFAGVVVLALVTTLLSAYLGRTLDEVETQRSAAEEARNRALSRQVAIQATQLRSTQPSLAAQLALAAYDLAPTVEARSRLLEVSGTPPVSRLVGPEGPVHAVAAPDGRLLATAASDGHVRLWEPGDDGAAPVLRSTVQAAGGGALFAAAVSPDGRLVAVGGAAGRVTLLDVTEPADPRVVGRPRAGVRTAVQDLAFSPDGRTLLAATSDPALVRWRLTGGSARVLPATRGFAEEVLAVAQSVTGVVATGGQAGVVRLWQPDGSRLAPVREIAVGSTLRSLEFSPDGRLLAAGADDSTVRVWHVGSGRPVVEPLDGFTSWVNGVAFDADGGLLAAAASGGLTQVWETESWRLRASIAGSSNHTSVQLLPGSRLLTGSIDGTGRVVDLTGPRLPPFGAGVWGLAAPATGDRLYVGVGQEAPMVAAVDVSEPLAPEVVGRPLRGPASAGPLDGDLGVAPDGRTLVAGTGSGKLVVWRVEGGRARRIGVVRAAAELVGSIAFSADGRHFVASSDDGSATVFAVPADGLPRRTARFTVDSLALGVAISPDSSLVAVGAADRTLSLFSVETRRRVALLEGFRNYVYSAAFSADGTLLAAGSADGTVRLWDVRDPGEPEQVGAALRGPSDTVFSVAFDARGDHLAAASQDGQVWLWSLTGSGDAAQAVAEPYARLGNLGADLYQVLPDPDREVVTAAGSGGWVGRWSTEVDRVRELVCRVAGAPISEEEWALYVPGAAYDPPCVSG
jgi:WD40 repeat protein/transcriptional regulator with XRE-family HTH domain